MRTTKLSVSNTNVDSDVIWCLKVVLSSDKFRKTALSEFVTENTHAIKLKIEMIMHVEGFLYHKYICSC